MLNSIEKEIIKQIEDFKSSELMKEFEKELDNMEKSVVKSIKDEVSVDEMQSYRGTLIALDKMRNIFNVIMTKTQHRLSNQA